MKPPLLIADDDPAIVRTLKRYFSRSRPVTTAASVRDGLALLEGNPPLCGAVFDHKFPDGNGLTLLQAFRRRDATAPVLMLTASHEPHVINGANAFDATFAVKPAPDSVFAAFAGRLAAADAERVSDIERAVAELADQYDLPFAELRLLSAASRGVSREELHVHLGVAESTIKTQIRTLVHRCGEKQLSDVLRVVLEWATSRRG